MIALLEMLLDDERMRAVISTEAGRDTLRRNLAESERQASVMQASLESARAEQALMREWLSRLPA